MAHQSIKFPPERRQLVVQLASEGKTNFFIAKELGVTKRMLMYRCTNELEAGRDIARSNGIALPPKPGFEAGCRDLTDEETFQLRTMAGYGLKIDQIATILGMGNQTLVANYQEEIERGRAEAHLKVTETLYTMATDGDHPNETKFYLKTQAGWKEATQIEFPDETGKPQRLIGSAVNLNLSADKMQNLIAILNDKV
jgi:hypothetical protein